MKKNPTGIPIRLRRGTDVTVNVFPDHDAALRWRKAAHRLIYQGVAYIGTIWSATNFAHPTRSEKYCDRSNDTFTPGETAADVTIIPRRGIDVGRPGIMLIREWGVASRTCGSRGGNMDIALLLNALTTAAVMGGVIFGAWQIRVANTARSTEVTLQILQMLHNHDLTEGLVALMDVPAGLNLIGLRERLGEHWSRAFHAIVMLDGLGLLVFRGEVSAELADDFFKHSVALAWEKFGATAVDMRKQQTDTAFEWLQWLAEAQAARGVRARVPAYAMAKS